MNEAQLIILKTLRDTYLGPVVIMVLASLVGRKLTGKWKFSFKEVFVDTAYRAIIATAILVLMIRLALYLHQNIIW